jgi:hypothetical protein
VFHRARENVGDGFNPTVRMPRKSLEIIFRIFVAEVIEQKKWIEFLRLAEAECALQLDAGALDRGRSLDNLFYRAE